MSLKLLNVLERGVPNKERVVISVQRGVDLKYFVLVDATQVTGGVIPGELSAFWFPTKQVKEGDSIVIYTGTGQASVAPQPDGKTVHFYFWGRPQTVFGEPSRAAVLFEVQTWTTAV